MNSHRNRASALTVVKTMDMNETQWDAKLKSFLKKTGEDVKRAGNDIKSEAEKLLKEVQDPERQAKVKAGMKDFGGWARKTAEEMAELMETGVKKAEVAINKATDKVVDFAVGQKPGEKKSAGSAKAQAAAESGPAIPDPTPPNAPSKPAKKSIGGKKRKPAAKKATAAKKPLGKAPPSGGDSAE
jgi:hypothetical protein